MTEEERKMKVRTPVESLKFLKKSEEKIRDKGKDSVCEMENIKLFPSFRGEVEDRKVRLQTKGCRLWPRGSSRVGSRCLL